MASECPPPSVVKRAREENLSKTEDTTSDAEDEGANTKTLRNVRRYMREQRIWDGKGTVEDHLEEIKERYNAVVKEREAWKASAQAFRDWWDRVTDAFALPPPGNAALAPFKK